MAQRSLDFKTRLNKIVTSHLVTLLMQMAHGNDIKPRMDKIKTRMIKITGNLEAPEPA